MASLDLTFDNISNADTLIGGSSSSITIWNRFFDISNNGSPFTSVIVSGNTVGLSGATNINLRDGLFQGIASILSVEDNAHCVTTAGNNCFANCEFVASLNFPVLISAGDSCFISCIALTSINFPLLATAGNYCFGLCSPTTIYLPSLIIASPNCFNSCRFTTNFNLPLTTTVGFNCFEGCVSVALLNLSSCLNLGESVDDNSVFASIIGKTFTLLIPVALSTCNAGSPDGDIQYLLSNDNVTINYILPPMVLQKKIQPKIFAEYNPTDVNNMASGFSLGQVWRNTLTNKEFLHRTDDEWIPLSFIIDNSFDGIQAASDSITILPTSENPIGAFLGNEKIIAVYFNGVKIYDWSSIIGTTTTTTLPPV